MGRALATGPGFFMGAAPSNRNNSENNSEFFQMRGRRGDPGLLCAAIPKRCAQIPCPPEQANAFAKTAKSVAKNSESAESEQGHREMKAEGFGVTSVWTQRCAGRAAWSTAGETVDPHLRLGRPGPSLPKFS